MIRETKKIAGPVAALSAIAAMLLAPEFVNAQGWTALSRIESGTTIQVRTTEDIDTQSVDGRVYTGTIENDVRDTEGRLAIPAGSTAELVVRRGPENEYVLDFDSVTINDRRYGVDATTNRMGTSGVDVRNSNIGANKETARNVGGGAILGALLGAAIGGGDAAAKGAIAGAAVGATAQILTKGKRIHVPDETVLSYRLESSLDLDVRDTGYERDGHHYHNFN